MSKKNKTRKTTSSKIQVLIDIAKVELLNKGISRFNYEKVIKSAGLSKSTVYENMVKRKIL